MRVAIALLAVSLATACSQESPAPPAPPRQGALDEGVVARVGDTEVSALTVALIAKQQQISPEQARDRAVFDALLVAAARQDLEPAAVRSATTRALARATVQQLWHEARATPISAAELQEATARNFIRYDRPVGYRAVHAVFRLKANAPPAKRKTAHELVERVLGAVRPAGEIAREQPALERDPVAWFTVGSKPVDPALRAFLKAVEEVDEAKEVLAQELPVIDAEGNFIDHGRVGGSVYPEFASAVAALTERGDLSPVFESKAGLHVVMLLEITPEKRVSEAIRREELRHEILALRAKGMKSELLSAASERLGIERSRKRDALLSQIKIGTAP